MSSTHILRMNAYRLSQLEKIFSPNILLSDEEYQAILRKKEELLSDIIYKHKNELIFHLQLID